MTRLLDDAEWRSLWEIAMQMRGLSKQEKRAFLDYKCAYYQYFIRLALIFTCFAEIAFLISDIELNNGEVMPTLVPRLSILVPLVIYIILERRATGSRAKTLLNYAIGECNVLATIWAVFHLQNKVHFAEGSFSMNLIFLVVGIGSSSLMCICNYLVFFAEIILTNQFVHFESMEILLSLNIPAAAAVIFAQIMLTFATYDAWQMTRQLKELVQTDPMTQVNNRMMLERMVKGNKLRNANGRITFIMLDVDKFKIINDSNGHETGDAVLRYLASKLVENRRDKDVIIRYGGDEFLIILYDCTAEGAIQYMNRVRRSIQMDLNNPSMRFTISNGICEYNGNFRETLRHADEALYEVKENGRNSQRVWTGTEAADHETAGT